MDAITRTIQGRKRVMNMWLCKRDLSRECEGKYRDCIDCVLDKIRAEIDEQYDRVHPYDISCAEGLEMALGIIDKYKAESEVQE